uniref:ANK_REP_REGION domain-containing protein n=1 Tax=Timema bartmani TaxID=61472 RepID=A0A7R9EVG6_9NEOP|nr:unnamed protein product [Timema bartmani]
MLQELCDNIRTAIEHGRTDIIRSLLEACDGEGTDPIVTREYILNNPLMEDGTFLYMATKLNQGDVVRTLLSCGADPGIQNTQGLNAIDVATSEHMRQIYVDELLRATANSEVGRVCQLVAAGININSWDSVESKNTPLHWAACYGNKEIVTCLIIEYSSTLGGLLWQQGDLYTGRLAMATRRLSPVSLLNTPLHSAACYGNKEIDTCLISECYFVSLNTPLHWAACYDNKEIVTCLISRGADVNSMNACGATPLHDAVIGTDDGVVQELLQAGANPLIQANKGVLFLLSEVGGSIPAYMGSAEDAYNQTSIGICSFGTSRKADQKGNGAQKDKIRRVA